MSLLGLYGSVVCGLNMSQLHVRRLFRMDQGRKGPEKCRNTRRPLLGVRIAIVVEPKLVEPSFRYAGYTRHQSDF